MTEYAKPQMSRQDILSKRNALLAKQSLLFAIGGFLADQRRDLEIELAAVVKELQNVCNHPNMRTESSALDPDVDIVEDCPECDLHREI